MARGLIFDLDDTLYRERRFALSAFHAVARAVAASHAVPADEGFRLLAGALRRGRRAQAFQDLAARAGLQPAAIETLRHVYRTHRPRLRLPRVTREVLAHVRATWRVGILTNGVPDVQRAKVRALGLAPLVDAVIYAHEAGPGKPDRAVFELACRSLRVSPSQAVMAGDDPWCDIDGARRAGLRAIRIRQGGHRDVEHGDTGAADATVGSIGEVPAAAARLVQEDGRHAD